MLTFYLSLVEDHNNDDDFERIYHKYRKMMYKIAKSHTGNQYLAEEAVQNALVNIARNIDRIKNFEEDYLELYLCKVSKNSAFSIMKKERRIAECTVALESAENKEFFQEVISETVIQKELLKMILDYIKSMEPQYSDILTYYYLHNLTLREISIVLKIPLSTVKTRFYASRRLIQEKFKEYKND